MTHHTKSASVPQHIYGYVAKEILYGLDPEKVGQFEPCVILGVTSIPSRALHFEILCESGAKWAHIPLHMLRHRLPSPDAVVHPLSELQAWDCHGWDFSTVQFEYLREMGCDYRTPENKMVRASYWFTLDHTDNGFSLYPPEHKNYNLLLLEDGSGQIAAMPNNRILWRDNSFVRPGPKLDYKVMPDVTWHAEESRINPQETAFTKDPEPVPEVAVVSGTRFDDVIDERLKLFGRLRARLSSAHGRAPLFSLPRDGDLLEDLRAYRVISRMEINDYLLSMAADYPEISINNRTINEFRRELFGLDVDEVPQAIELPVS